MFSFENWIRKWSESRFRPKRLFAKAIDIEVTKISVPILANFSRIFLELLEQIFLHEYTRLMLLFKSIRTVFWNFLSSTKKVDFTEHYAKPVKSLSGVFASFAQNTIMKTPTRLETMENSMEILPQFSENFWRVFEDFERVLIR